jgi:hypothetical protein
MKVHRAVLVSRPVNFKVCFTILISRAKMRTVIFAVHEPAELWPTRYTVTYLVQACL